MEMKEIIVIGGFSEVFELCEFCGYKIFGYVDSKNIYSEYNYLGNDKEILKEFKKYNKYPIVISPDNSKVRRKLFDMYTGKGFNIISLVSPKAYVSKSAQIGKGCIIQSFCNVSCDVKLGRGVRLNTYSNIMHDVTIGDYSIIAPNSVLLGRCEIGEETYVGANATILPNVNIGSNCLIGAASVVTKDFADGLKVCGNPAREMR